MLGELSRESFHKYFPDCSYINTTMITEFLHSKQHKINESFNALMLFNTLFF